MSLAIVIVFVAHICSIVGKQWEIVLSIKITNTDTYNSTVCETSLDCLK